MILGDIFLWDTTQAIGHERRWKYHVYICPLDWRAGHTFLFISKANYGCDYEIRKADYPFLTLDSSFISCTGIVHYDDKELNAFPKKAVGRLAGAHLKELNSAIGAGGAMVAWEELRVCNALNAVP